MGNQSHGPHSNPVWSTFVFVVGMLLFLFYLETMIKPMDVLTAKSFSAQSLKKETHSLNGSVFAKYGDLPLTRVGRADNVLVFMHIQKTAGKCFNAHIALDLNPQLGPKCTCQSVESDRCDLLKPGSCVCEADTDRKPIWLFSRLSVGWPCGVHPGWTDLSLTCLDTELNHRENKTGIRKYFLSTILRNPINRYLSEWIQVTSHGQWPTKKIYCHPLSKIKSHFNGNWTGVSLDKFIECPDNPGHNRQVRMLTDLRVVQCDEVTTTLKRSDVSHNNSLLENAKRNLEDMPFFGLLEFPSETDLLFEHTFGVKFIRNFPTYQFKPPLALTREQRNAIRDRNKLDIEFYDFAKKLFFQRLKRVSQITTSSVS